MGTVPASSSNKINFCCDGLFGYGAARILTEVPVRECCSSPLALSPKVSLDKGGN